MLEKDFSTLGLSPEDLGLDGLTPEEVQGQLE